MNRDLLSGRCRSLFVGLATWLLRTDGSGTFDPSCVITSGTATWLFGDGDSQTSNSASHAYATTGNYPVSWDVPPELVEQLNIKLDGISAINTKPWTNLTYLNCSDNLLTSLDTFAAWINIRTLHCGLNSLTSLGTFAAWTDIRILQCGSNSLTSLETFADWTSLETLYCSSNSLTSLDTFADWTSLTYLSCFSNSLTALNVFAAWTNLQYLYCQSNLLSPAVIDSILIALDAAGNTNGVLNYGTNPGSADLFRSSAAVTAKANLIAKGWTITT